MLGTLVAGFTGLVCPILANSCVSVIIQKKKKKKINRVVGCLPPEPPHFSIRGGSAGPCLPQSARLRSARSALPEGCHIPAAGPALLSGLCSNLTFSHGRPGPFSRREIRQRLPSPRALLCLLSGSYHPHLTTLFTSCFPFCLLPVESKFHDGKNGLKV